MSPAGTGDSRDVQDGLPDERLLTNTSYVAAPVMDCQAKVGVVSKVGPSGETTTALGATRKLSATDHSAAVPPASIARTHAV